MTHPRPWVLLLVAALVLYGLVPSGPAPAQEKDDEVTIYRDSFGVPHIFAKTEEGAAHGMGYAQAEDRLEELLKQYRRAEGSMAEAFGEKFIQHDYRQRLWRHRAVAESNYPKLPAKIRALCEAYQAGIRRYMREHPREVPAWAPELRPWQIIALSRFIIWGWPQGDAGGDLLRAGIRPDPISPRGSNQWVVAPNRTADRAPLALIDPHLSWYGEFRFYEARLYGGELATSGVAIPGLPLTTLGHNRYCSVAMTTGGPDAADVYEEEVNPANQRQYRYDGAWRDMTTRRESIRVKEGAKVVEKVFEIDSTHHGPVVARRKGKAYAMKLPYMDEYRLPEQAYRMATARNLDEMKKALALFQLMEQNVMVATVDGEIYYVRNGRVPIRPKGYNWRLPVPGNTSASEWLGIHALGDLVQLHNPWQGYMQNCNVAPQHITRFCPLTPERYAERPYLHNADNPLHQRAATVLELLHTNTRMTVADAMEVALSPQVWGADLWQARLAAAWEKASARERGAKAARLYELILNWNRRADSDSTGAVAFRFWMDHLGAQAINPTRAGQEPPKDIPDAQLLRALAEGAADLDKRWGRLEVKYGEMYRVGRRGTGRTWPVGGGSVPGVATARAISFDATGDGKTYLARSGQTSVQLVQLKRPPRSWTLLPLGQSDRPDSKHYDDQAEKLFSPGRLKPTYFLDRAELLRHVESRKVLRWPAGS
ncbi:MAG: penicillin acylase family protein [Gemmataceae bacterium]|nr:penicillin acylase family protein [Gemmataceae bacterium]